MGGAIGAVTRVFDALCASPFATRMGDTHHVATCTRTAVDRYRPDDLARAPVQREDCTLAAWYRSLYAPRTGGAYDGHHQTAGIAGRTRRRGFLVFLCERCGARGILRGGPR